MKALFGDILKLDGVWGIMLFSFEGQIIFKELLPGPSGETPKGELGDSWMPIIAAMNQVREADLIFESSRLYIRRTELGYLLVLMGAFAQTAMVRLNCDILLPSLRETKGGARGLKRLFKKKR